MADKEITSPVAQGAPPAFDIAELAAEDTAEMVINHPITNAPTTWVWIIAGPGHPASVKADREAGDEARRESMAQDKARINGRKWNPEFVDTAEQQKKNVRYFAQKVLSWTPVKLDGAEFKYSPDNVNKILLDPKFRNVYSQFLDFITDERSFMKPSSPS